MRSLPSTFPLGTLSALVLSTACSVRGQDSETAPAPALNAPAGAKKPVKINLQMVDGLRFEPPRFGANPGDELVISLENADATHQSHNFLVVQPGKLKAVVQKAMELGDNGPKQDYIPIAPEVLVHSKMLEPEKTNIITFKLPAEKGIYPFVCTMPGHGMVMYGAIYSGVKMPPLAKDLDIPPQALAQATPGSGQRPFVQRIFMPDAGPAAIAVALPGNQNFCWDAGDCRLRYVWKGPFIDASANWRGSGRDLPVVPALAWWTAPKDAFPLALGAAPAASAPARKFLGYAMKNGLPEFHYRLGAIEVFETISAAPNGDGIADHFRIPQLSQSLRLVLPSAGPKWTSSAGPLDAAGGRTLTPGQAADFTLTLLSGIPAPAHHH